MVVTGPNMRSTRVTATGLRWVQLAPHAGPLLFCREKTHPDPLPPLAPVSRCFPLQEADDIAQILGGMSLAASVPCDPVPQGQHLRFEEELDGAAVVSPTRSRVVLRGVPEPEGTHVVFN